MTRPRMPVGNDLFDLLRGDGSYYIDKTGLIPELLRDKDNKVTLLTRPRRFGKTLNMSMLDCFFDINRDSKALFEGLEVSKDTEICDEYMNKYPTVFLSFKEIKGLDLGSALGMLRYVISDLYSKYNFLNNSDKVSEEDKQRFERLQMQNADITDLKFSLDIMMRMLFDYYKKPVIVLLDEYDVPISYANENGYYDQMIDIIRSMFGAAFKTNPYLKFAVITGCLRIAKESIFTGTKNFACYTITNPEFCQYFGFTAKEVGKLLKDCGLSDKADKVREWYDGYVFGDTEVYCPWNVISYVSALLKNPDAEPENYWRNTSHNGIIRSFVDMTDYDVSDRFETLLNGGTVTQKIAEELTYNELFDSEENLWSMLYMTGYLTKAEKSSSNAAVLRIPNKEVMTIFRDTVVRWFSDNVDRSRQKELMQAFWSGNEELAGELMSDFLWDTISYHDYREDYYHAFLVGIFTGMGYEIESDREYGLGSPDIVVKHKKTRSILMIETKRADSEEALESSCNEAVEQIKEKMYVKGVPHGYRNIMCYGVGFYQKTCKVKLYKE